MPYTDWCNGGGCEEKEDVFMEGSLKEYYRYLCGKYRKKYTVSNYFNMVKRFVEFTNNRVNYETVEQWKIWANNHYKRKNSLKSNINAINVYLKWLKKPELCMKNVNGEESDEYSLTEEEFDRVLVESKQSIENALIFELLRHLIRPSGVINLKLKHRNGDRLYIADTDMSGKTGSGYVVMSQDLQNLWDRYQLIRPVPLPEYQDYLLIDNENKWRGYKYKTTLPIRNRIYELGRRAGISKRVKPYTIKRSSITLMLDKNSKYFVGDPKIVQQMARHKKLETTMKYDRRDENDIRNYHNSLNNIREKTGDIIRRSNIYTLVIV